MNPLSELALKLLEDFLLANGAALLAYASAKLGPAVAGFITSHLHNKSAQTLALSIAKAAGTVATADIGKALAGAGGDPAALLAGIKAQLGPQLLAQALKAYETQAQVDTVLTTHLESAKVRATLPDGMVLVAPATSPMPAGARPT